MKKKKLLMKVMSLLCAIAIVITPGSKAFAADSSAAGLASTAQGQDVSANVNADLNATSNYMMNTYLNNRVSEQGYVGSYNDYYEAVLCIKAGTSNDEVLNKMDAELASQFDEYNADSFLNAYSSNGVKSYALAITILYLQERGVDVTSYHENNLLTMLHETFLTESDINPYAYQVVAAVVNNTTYDWTAVSEKINNDVLIFYTDGSTGNGVGIDCWGFSVSVDDNGQVLPALLDKYNSDSDIKDKVDAAIAWNKTQADSTGAVISWGAPSPDSTALALKLAAQYNDYEDAEYYYGGMAQFKSTTTKGMYTYYGSDNDFATFDALFGLLAYSKSLDGKGMFDVVYRTQETGQDNQETQESGEKESGLESQDETQPAQTTAGELAKKNESDIKDTSVTNASDTPATADTTEIYVFLAGCILSAGIFTWLKMRGSIKCQKR